MGIIEGLKDAYYKHQTSKLDGQINNILQGYAPGNGLYQAASYVKQAVVNTAHRANIGLKKVLRNQLQGHVESLDEAIKQEEEKITSPKPLTWQQRVEPLKNGTPAQQALYQRLINLQGYQTRRGMPTPADQQIRDKYWKKLRDQYGDGVCAIPENDPIFQRKYGDQFKKQGGKKNGRPNTKNK